jgi:7-cyano-7-deazaguanine synthase
MVLLSGGTDSAACAYLLKAQGMAVEGIFFDYGQPAAPSEQIAAQAIAEHIDIPLSVVTARGPAKYGAGEVVGRNAFLILGSIVFKPTTVGILALGIHAGTPYYDCSAEFVRTMTVLVAEHTDGALILLAPFLDWNKKQIYDYFTAAKLPIELTYSCEAGTTGPCTECNSCRDRSALGCQCLIA